MKDQFVIACLGDLTMAEEVISHAGFLSKMLNKGLILLYVEDPRYKSPTVKSVEPRLLQWEQEHPEWSPSHVAMKGSTRDVVNALPTLLNGVVAVTGVNAAAPRRSATHPREVLHLFKECKIAYLTVQTGLHSRYQSVGYGVDFRKESKEKLIWASYFARFNHSQLHMLHYDYSDEGLRGKWQNNVRFMNKFFKSVGVNCDSLVVTQRAVFPETRVCDTAAEQHCDLLISVTTDTRDLDILEWFAGVAEQRTIRNAAHLPVLYLNPRDDIYVLCD